ncbi:MAG: C39 family peptidase [Phycisphaerae bacterium]|nr:C39 family peptidase [Phycisphaerae bacterium]
MTRTTRGGLIVATSTCLACALAGLGYWSLAPAQAAAAPALTDRVQIDGVPHIRQRPDFCGEACIAMVLRKLGHKATQDDVFNLSGLDPALGRGCITREMAAVLERIGFRPGKVWHKIDPKQSSAQIEAQWQSLLADLRRGIPTVVCMRYDDRPGATEHFRLILGYDAPSDKIIYHEPAETDGAYWRMKRDRFLDLWPLEYSKSEWLLIRMRMDPGKISLPKRPDGFTNADFAQHVRDLRPRVPQGFAVVVQPPFVVIGDEPPRTVKARSDQTVKWFVDRIRQLYFKKDPPAIYDIWLFKDDKSYRKHTKQIFNDEPDTPFGYFSHHHGALVMNIATGGGTLCHEIVHAFMPSNFPECPAWFNEGLASLYEQCAARNGRVWGLTNWRLAGLQEAIRAKTLPPFKQLLTTTTDQFYGMSKGDSYAQARYLCYYLQTEGLLTEYYEAFRKHAKTDPSGYKTLERILSLQSEDEMRTFQQKWHKWVLDLRFP